MKKLSLLLALLLVFFATCGFAEEEGSRQIVFLTNEPTDSPQEQSALKDEEPAMDEEPAEDLPAMELTESDFTLRNGAFEARLGEDPSDVIDAISEIEGCAPSVIEIKGSIYSPDGIEYSGKNISVRTAPSEDGDTICAIFVDTDDWETSRGIKVGDKVEDVFSKYGDSDYVVIDDCIYYYPGKDCQKDIALLFQIDTNTDTVFSMAVLEKNSVRKTR